MDVADVCLVAAKEGKKRLEKCKTVTRAEVEITTTPANTHTIERKQSRNLWRRTAGKREERRSDPS